MKPQDQSKGEHILSLAQELLDDIELSRLSAESLLLKATRLARLAGSEKIQRWLSYEIGGYNSRDHISLEFMSRTGRWSNYDQKKGYWEPLAQQEASIQALRIELQSVRVPDGTNAMGIINNILNKTSSIRQQIQIRSGIKSRVVSILHEFVASIYYEKVFSGLAENIFESYKEEIDAIIAEQCGDVLEKLPFIYDRLREGDSEAVSQGLTTCRRIIDAFANAIYPPTDETVEIGGNTLKLGANHHQNRLNAYIAERVLSDSRKQKLRQSLSNLYSRVSAGVHDEVTPQEAKALLLSTYLFLGEVLTLDKTEKHTTPRSA
jgi:hypothetical protein